MSFNVIPSKKLVKEAKRLSRKYASLKEDHAPMNDELKRNRETGTSLGNNL
jgi:mRNA-degrading endonuclease RelE of RelBE toxin-antitoxin system